MRSATRRPLDIGAAVRLEGLPAAISVTARLVNCIPISDYEKFWLLGLALMNQAMCGPSKRHPKTRDYKGYGVTQGPPQLHQVIN